MAGGRGDNTHGSLVPWLDFRALGCCWRLPLAWQWGRGGSPRRARANAHKACACAAPSSLGSHMLLRRCHTALPPTLLRQHVRTALRCAALLRRCRTVLPPTLLPQHVRTALRGAALRCAVLLRRCQRAAQGGPRKAGRARRPAPSAPVNAVGSPQWGVRPRGVTTGLGAANQHRLLPGLRAPARRAA